MSGGDAVSPFTTPDSACGYGLPAGNTDTRIRRFLLDRGYQVYTAPAQNGRGVVVDPTPDSFGAFGEQPEVLGEQYTVNSVGDIDLAGEHLARFVGLLHDRYGVDEVDFIGHSNGGLYARSAIRTIGLLRIPVRVMSLTTLGTPWMGSYPLRWVFGEISDSDLMGQKFATAMAHDAPDHVRDGDLGLAQENTYHYMVGPKGWNEFQIGVLDRIPVYMVGGTWFTAEGGSEELWPNDGLVTAYSALAQGLPEAVAPLRRTREFRVTHSIFVSDAAGKLLHDPDLTPSTAMTWNDEVLESVHEFLMSSTTEKL